MLPTYKSSGGTNLNNTNISFVSLIQYHTGYWPGDRRYTPFSILHCPLPYSPFNVYQFWSQKHYPSSFPRNVFAIRAFNQMVSRSIWGEQRRTTDKEGQLYPKSTKTRRMSNRFTNKIMQIHNYSLRCTHTNALIYKDRHTRAPTHSMSTYTGTWTRASWAAWYRK